MTGSDLAVGRTAVEAVPEDIDSEELLFRAALARGLPAKHVSLALRFSRPPERWLQISVGRRRYLYRRTVMYSNRRLFGWKFGLINGKASLITGSKHKTSQRLREVGLPVPQGLVFARTESAAALDYFHALGREVCVKPDVGQRGDDIVPRINDPVHFSSVFARAAERHDRIRVEESVAGDIIRYMVVGTEVAAVRLDRPASVLGDGVSTIAELAERRNAETRAAKLSTWGEIILDGEAERVLALEGLSLASRIPAGQRAFLRATSNIPTGAEGIGSPPGLHPSYAASTLKAVAAIPGLVLSAVDLMVADYRQPASPTNHWFLDLNSGPGITNFHFPREGAPSDVAGFIIDWLIKGGPR
jgi:D-alanine-D-alanine ligase-like ATP-grasp enzyme